MKRNDIFLIGLGARGNAIVKQLITRSYKGIMIDCSINNMDLLGMQRCKDYYILGATGGTSGERAKGKENVRKDLWKVQDRLTVAKEATHIVIVTCAASGVSGGSEVLVREMKDKCPSCEISIVTLIMSTWDCLYSLHQTIDMCKENRKLKQEGIVESDIYVLDTISNKIDGIVDELDEAFSNQKTGAENKTLEMLIQQTNNTSFMVGEKAQEHIAELKKELVNDCSRRIRECSNTGIREIYKFCDAAMNKEKQIEEKRQKQAIENGEERDRGKELVEDMNELYGYKTMMFLGRAVSDFKRIIEYVDSYLSVVSE